MIRKVLYNTKTALKGNRFEKFEWLFGSLLLAISCAGVMLSDSHAAPASIDPPQAGSSPTQVASPSSGTPDPLRSIVNTSEFVNEFTGQAAFTIPLGSISNHGGISYALNLSYYGGGVEHNNPRKLEFNPTSWVGEGFSLKAPYILADTKGTVDAGDDTYQLSLDGTTKLDLIPETGNPNSLYPKINPYIHIARATGSLFSGWTVTLQDGISYHFESCADANSCDAAKNTFCLPIQGVVFHSVPLSTKAPVIWYLSSISSRDGAFRILFDYHKVIGGAADRAVYLEKIRAVNGSDANSQLVSEMTFQREAKPDYVDNSFRDPLASFEAERLLTVNLQNQGQPVRNFNFQYQIGKTRLVGITEAVGQHERSYYKCDYDATNAWQIKKVTGPSGLIWEYGYGSTAINSGPHGINLAGLSAAGLQVGYTGEFNGKYYVLVGTVPDTLHNISPRALYEFERRGTYWNLFRTYTMSTRFSTFTMAPNGNYFALASPDGQYADSLQVFNLLDSNLNGISTIDLTNPATYPSSFRVLQQNLYLQYYWDKLWPPRKGDPALPLQIFAFNNWMAIYRPGYGAVRFFRKDSQNTWTLSCPDYGDQSHPDPFVLPIASPNTPSGLGFKLRPKGQSNPCWSWNALDSSVDGVQGGQDVRLLDVRQGDNFVAVILHNVGLVAPDWDMQWTMGHAIRIFANIGDSIQWIDPNNTTVYDGVGTGFGGQAVTTWGSYCRRSQCNDGNYNNFMLDVSIQGDLVGALLRRIEPTSNTTLENNYVHVFAVDLSSKTLKGFYSEAIPRTQERVEYGDIINKSWISTDDTHLYMGPNFMLLKRRSTGIVSNSFQMDGYIFNRLTGQTDAVSIPTRDLRFNTSVRIMGNYFFLESLYPVSWNGSNAVENVNDLVQSYKQPVSGSLYPTLGEGTLFQISPRNGTTPPNVAVIPLTGLNQVVVQGDVYIGYNNATGAQKYVYGRMNEQGITSNVINSSPMSAVLSPSGILEFNSSTTAPQFRFHEDYKGSLSPSTITAVNQVQISTKGDISSPADGSKQTIQFDYSGALAQYNANGKTPNFKKVNRILAGPSSQTITEYAADFEGAELVGALQNLHGMPVTITTRPGPASGRQPGEKETQMDYTVAELGTAPDALNQGAALRQKVQATRVLKSTEKVYFFGGVRKSETRYSDFDGRNGLPRVAINAHGGDYQMNVSVFDDAASTSKTLVKQKASFLFTDLTSDPCLGSSSDPCSNINTPWFLAADSRKKKAMASQSFTYTSQGDLNQTFSWRPMQIGVTGLQTLDGSVTIPAGQTEQTAGKWVKESEVLSRAKDVAVALSKHNGPTTTDMRGVKTTTFYGGLEGLPLATAENASKTVCTFLGAEEENTGTGFGAFGDWEPIGSISTDMAHSGQRSIKSTGAFGPSLNIHFKQDSEFWARGKGMLVSGWMFVPGTNNGNPQVDPVPAASVELRTSDTAAPSVIFNLIPPNIPYNRWVKLERLVTWKELNNIGGTDPVMRVWFGKAPTLPPAPQNTLPVYVDDLRIHPADATMTSQNYDARDRVVSVLDAANFPTFLQYNVWDENIGAKDDRGNLFSASADKRAGEE